MNAIELALKTALEVHKGQVDKGGSAYILHPIRVMMQMTSDEERIVALLHDSVEDSDWLTLAQVETLFGPTVAAAVDAITKRHDETYEAYLERVRANPCARAVKLADLTDNSDTSRLSRELDDADEKRLEKYRYAKAFLAM